MKIPNTYPFELSNNELIEIINKLQTRLSTEIITDGEKKSITNLIQLGQNQIVSNDIIQNIENLKAQTAMLNSILENNNTTSRITKTLSYIMIAIALVSLYFSYTTINSETSNNARFKFFKDSICNRIDLTNNNLKNIHNELHKFKMDTLYMHEIKNIESLLKHRHSKNY